MSITYNFFMLSDVWERFFTDTVRVKDTIHLTGRLYYVYPLHPWKEEQALRLYTFLQRYDRFTREQMKLWLYRELYLFRAYRFESKFVKVVLKHILDMLEHLGYTRAVEDHWHVIEKPSLEECKRILRSKIVETIIV